jgi:hypothetical protein
MACILLQIALGIRWYYSPAAKESPWKVTSIIYQIAGEKYCGRRFEKSPAQGG